MRTRITFCGMVIAMTLTSLQAQYDTIQLDQYRLPDMKRQQLDFSINSLLNHNNETGPRYFILNYLGNTNLTYSAYFNSLKYQGEITSNLAISPIYSKNETGVLKSRRSSFESTMQGSSENRYYFKGLFFLEGDANVNLYRYYYLRKDNNYDFNSVLTSWENEESTNTSASLEIPILIGYGRVERVEDYRLAIYILNDLKKLGKLKKDPAEIEILDIASIISKIKNKRFFDSRIRKIEEMKEIDAYLQEKGLINSTDAVYFTSLKDNWDYSAGPERNAGYRIFTGPFMLMAPSHYKFSDLAMSNVGDTIYHSEFETKTKNIDFGYKIGLAYNKPLNLYWQLTAGINGDFILNNGEFTDTQNNSVSNSKSKNYIIIPIEYIQLGFYPNSRTYSSLRLSTTQMVTRLKIYEESNDTWKKQADYFSPDISAQWQLSYYFSPQLRLSANYILYLSSDKSNFVFSSANIHTSFSNYLNLGFTYSFF